MKEMKTIEHVIGEACIKANFDKPGVDIEVVQLILGLERDHATSLMAILAHERLKRAHSDSRRKGKSFQEKFGG